MHPEVHVSWIPLDSTDSMKGSQGTTNVLYVGYLGSPLSNVAVVGLQKCSYVGAPDLL